MHYRRLLISLLAACLAGLLLVTPGRAIPPLPSSFYGVVKLNGQNAPDGTVIRALIGGIAYAQAQTQTYQGNSVYSLDIPGDDPSTPAVEGGREGEAIQFEVAGAVASQTGTWHSGTNVNLVLSAAASSPQATVTHTPTQTLTPAIQAPTLTPSPTQAAPTTAQPTAAIRPSDTAGAGSATILPPGATSTASLPATLTNAPTGVTSPASSATLPAGTATSIETKPAPAVSSAAATTPDTGGSPGSGANPLTGTLLLVSAAALVAIAAAALIYRHTKK